MPVHVRDARVDQNGSTSAVLSVTDKEQSFVFEGVTEKPVPSLLRNFSAPVKLQYPYTDDELIFMLKHDSDGFNRWDAAQQLSVKLILSLVKAYRADEAMTVPEAYTKAFASVLADAALDKLFVAELLTLPSPSYVIELMPVADIEGIFEARQVIKRSLATALRSQFLDILQTSQTAAYVYNAEDMGTRRLKNVCLWYLASPEDSGFQKDVFDYLTSADNLTDIMGAMTALNDIDCAMRDNALTYFYERYQGQHLVLDKWFTVQAMTTLPRALSDVQQLMSHPAFDIKNPNKARSLIGGFGSGNILRFHEADGSGYRFIADQVTTIDQFNPQVAARLIEPLIRWRKFDVDRQDMMKSELERIGSNQTLSKDLYEIVTRSLSG